MAVVAEVINATEPNEVPGPPGAAVDPKYGPATGRPPRRGPAGVLALIPRRVPEAWRMVRALLTRGALAAAVAALAAGIAGCGQVSPAVVGPGPGRSPRSSEPASRVTEFTSHGHVIAQITIPTSAGFALPVGPPSPGRMTLTGLRRPPRPGQLLTLDLTFARAGHVILCVPVIP